MYPDGVGVPIYSDFLPVMEGVAPYPAITKGKEMDFVSGNETMWGVGLQPFFSPHDKPYKAQWVGENPSGRVRPELSTFASRALFNSTARRRKTGAGRAVFPYSIPLEATPNGVLAIALIMLFGQPTTTRVGGTAATLSSNAIATATSISVTALAAAIPSGAVLNFSLSRTLTLTADAAAGDVSLAVSATPSAIPNNTAINFSGVWFRTTSSASSGATTLAVSALPAALESGDTGAYTQNRYATTTAVANTGATSISVAALASALTSGDSAYYGAKYRHEWINNKAYNVATFVQLVADYVEVSPGAFANQMEWTTDFTMDTFVTPTLQGNALNMLKRYSLAQTGLDVAAVDNLNSFSMIDARIVIDGVESEDVKSAQVQINRNAIAKGVLRRKRGVSRYKPSVTDITMNLSLYHISDEAFIQKYFGHAVEQTEEYGITCENVKLPVSLEYATCPILEGDLSYEWGVIFPKASIETLTADIPGENEIMEDVTLVGNFDSSIGSDAKLYLVNDQTLADMMTPYGAITPVPANHVTTYVSA